MSRLEELRSKVESAKAKGSFAGLSIRDASWVLDQLASVQSGQPTNDDLEPRLREDLAFVSQQKDKLKRKSTQAVLALRDIRDSFTATADELREKATLVLKELGEQ